MSYDLTDASAFKGWARKRHKAAAMLKEIIFQWRSCNIPVKGKPGPWAVHKIETWANWFGASERTAKRHLKELSDEGLILKSYHTFDGPGRHLYLQPTKLALTHLGRPNDLSRLVEKNGPKGGPKVGPKHGPKGGPDNTSSLPLQPVLPDQECAGLSTLSKVKVRPKTKEKTASSEAAEPAPIVGKKPAHDKLAKFDPQSPEGKLAVKLGAITKDKKLKGDQKRAQLLKLLPPLPGAIKVKHPSELHPKWHTWSPELLVSKHKQYEEYVANELKTGGTKIKGSWAAGELDDNEVKEITAYYDKLAQSKVA